jgi:hypothetical protein
MMVPAEAALIQIAVSYLPRDHEDSDTVLSVMPLALDHKACVCDLVGQFGFRQYEDIRHKPQQFTKRHSQLNEAQVRMTKADRAAHENATVLEDP